MAEDEQPICRRPAQYLGAKRFKRVESAASRIWKLLTVAEKRFRRLNAPYPTQGRVSRKEVCGLKARLN